MCVFVTFVYGSLVHNNTIKIKYLKKLKTILSYNVLKKKLIKVTKLFITSLRFSLLCFLRYIKNSENKKCMIPWDIL